MFCEELTHIFLNETSILDTYKLAKLMKRGGYLEARIDCDYLIGELGKIILAVEDTYIEIYFEGEGYILRARNKQFIAMRAENEIVVAGENCEVSFKI